MPAPDDVPPIKRTLVDRGDDAVLSRADPAGPTCHTGERYRFLREMRLA